METVLLLHAFPSWSKHGTASKVLERDWAAWVRMSWCYSAHIKRSQQGFKRTASFPLSILREKALWERKRRSSANNNIFKGEVNGTMAKYNLGAKNSQSSRQLIIFLLFRTQSLWTSRKAAAFPRQTLLSHYKLLNTTAMLKQSQVYFSMYKDNTHLHRVLIYWTLFW